MNTIQDWHVYHVIVSGAQLTSAKVPHGNECILCICEEGKCFGNV